MVAPHAQAVDTAHGAAGFEGDLAQGAVVVEAQHGGEIARGQVGRGFHGDIGVGVGGVAHHEHFHVAVGHLVQRGALRGEDVGIGVQQVGPLHAFAARACADQNSDFRILKRSFGIAGGKHIGQQREGAVLQLHNHALHGLLRLWQIEQLQDNGLVCAEHVSSGDAK